MRQTEAASRAPGKPTPRGRMQILAPRGGAPRVYRLFHRWGERSVDVATAGLQEALKVLEGDSDGELLIAGAGFACVRLAQPTNERLPTEEEFEGVTDAARQVADAIRSGLPPHHPAVVFGIDVLATCRRSTTERGVGQFAVVLKPGEAPALLAKRFPMPAEDAYLRVLDEGPPNPTCETPLGRAVVLVCHDVNVYSPRGAATTVYESRADRRAALQGQVRVAAPAFGLHLAHYVETSAGFRQAYSVWGAEVGVPLFGVSGLPSDVSTEDAAGLAASLLGGADGWPVLDLLEQPTE